MNFISAHLLRKFYSWSKHKRICTVRQYSGNLAHPRGMYYNGKEGRKELTVSCPSTTGDIGGHSVFLYFRRDIVLFTHIHLLFYCVVFLNNQRRHPEVMSLLATTILSLSLSSLISDSGIKPSSVYQTNFHHRQLRVCRLAGRASIFSDIRRQE